MKTVIIRTQKDFDALDRTQILDFNLKIEMLDLTFEGNLLTDGNLDCGRKTT